MARWVWHEKRQKALELFVAGVSRRRIAATIGTHRNTINQWCKHPEFLAEARARLDELTTATRVRRLRETIAFSDRVAKLAREHLSAVERGAGDREARSFALSWLAEFRRWLDFERREIGAAMEPSHLVQQPTAMPGLGEAVRVAVERGQVDLDRVSTDSPLEFLLSVTDQLLQNSDLLEHLDEDERLRKEPC